MLKNIPAIISPELIKILMEMGHGEIIVLGDGNFPALSCAKKLIRCDGHGIPELLETILKFFPLDDSIEKPVVLMHSTSEVKEDPVIWLKYKEIVNKYEENKGDNFAFIAKNDFYERAKKASAIVATGEKTRFANIILRKGIVSCF